MDKLGGSVEFLCLSCGVQGLCSTGRPDSTGASGEIICPRCGASVLTIHLHREKASLVISV